MSEEKEVISRRMLRKALGTLVLALGASLVLAPGASAARQLRGVGMTPNWNAAPPFTVTAGEQLAEVNSLCRMHASLMRFWVSWSDLEPKQGQFDPAYAGRVDQVLHHAARCRVKVLVVLSVTPRWASDVASTEENTVQPAWSRARALPGLFQSFVARFLTRYPGVYAIEVWNEPNCCPDGHFTGTPAQYATLVNEAVAGKQQAGSPAKIVAGSLLGMGDVAYLEELYAAGMHGQNGISIHPYTWGDPVDPNGNLLLMTPAVHAVMLAHGDQGGIWLTEFGVAACPATACFPPETQASYLARIFKIEARLPFVRGLTSFSVRDIPWTDPEIPFWDRRMGLLTADFQRRPAWFALRKAFTKLNHAHRHPRKHRHR